MIKSSFNLRAPSQAQMVEPAIPVRTRILPGMVILRAPPTPLQSLQPEPETVPEPSQEPSQEPDPAENPPLGGLSDGQDVSK